MEIKVTTIIEITVLLRFLNHRLRYSLIIIYKFKIFLRTYGLRFAYVNADNPSSQKWLNEIMFQKYRSMGEENDIDISDDEYDDIIKANLNKLDYDRSLICLAINQQRRHFLIFNIDIKNLFTTCDSNVTEACFGLDDSRRFENKYQIELTNWLDKLTEGLNMSDKFTVKNWPDFN